MASSTFLISTLLKLILIICFKFSNLEPTPIKLLVSSEVMLRLLFSCAFLNSSVSITALGPSSTVRSISFLACSKNSSVLISGFSTCLDEQADKNKKTEKIKICIFISLISL